MRDLFLADMMGGLAIYKLTPAAEITGMAMIGFTNENIGLCLCSEADLVAALEKKCPSVSRHKCQSAVKEGLQELIERKVFKRLGDAAFDYCGWREQIARN